MKFASSLSYTLLVKHLYVTAGQYTVTVNVSNVLSHLSRSVQAVVQPPIGGVTVTLQPGHAVETNTPLVAVATVATGNGLHFSWQYPDSAGQPVIRK